MNSVTSGAVPVDTRPTPPIAAEQKERSEPSGILPTAVLSDDMRRARRAERIGLLSVSLGAAGLGGAWQSATATVSAPISVSDGLFGVSGLVWLVLLAEYVRHGGAHWANLRHDLSHPGQGFALAYVPIVGMLFAGHFSRFGLDAARWAYAAFAVTAAVVAARLLAHWLTGTLSSSPLHPGYLLPVSSGPFIASITASTLRLPEVADGAFAVGLLYWLAFGTVVLGSLVANPGLPRRARPTLTVLSIPPATGAWHGQRRIPAPWTRSGTGSPVSWPSPFSSSSACCLICGSSRSMPASGPFPSRSPPPPISPFDGCMAPTYPPGGRSPGQYSQQQVCRSPHWLWPPSSMPSETGYGRQVHTGHDGRRRAISRSRVERQSKTPQPWHPR